MKKLKILTFSKFWRKQDGSSLIEFAIVAPVFFILFFGIIEFGLFTYHKIAIERLAFNAARMASIGKISDDGACSGTADRLSYLQCFVGQRSLGLINGDRIRMHVNDLSGNVGGSVVPDICLDDLENPTSEALTCDRFEDINGDGDYDSAPANNVGGAGQTMEMLIYYPWTVQIPLFNNFFGSPSNKGIVMLSASTTFKNEPL